MVMKPKLTQIQAVLFACGIFLLLVNSYGLTTSLRNPNLQEEINRINQNDITLSQDQIYEALDAEIPDRIEYLYQAADAIHNGIGQYWEDEGSESYNLRVPFQENYLLFMVGIMAPERFHKFEFTDYRRAIERGVGMCSQHAIITAEALYARGWKTKMIGLSGHVVASVLIDEGNDTWWIVDTDYGVIIPASIQEIEKNPELISRHYAEKGYPPDIIAHLERVYGSKDNFVSDGYGIGNYLLKTRYLEKSSYILIWIIPFLLMTPLTINLIQKFSSKKQPGK